MKVNFSYKQNENKLVNRYVSDPKITDPKEITDFIMKASGEFLTASGGKFITVQLYNVFDDVMKLEFFGDGLYWVKK